MIAAARIARRLMRKIVKPAALWLTIRAMRTSAQEVARLLQMREDIVDLARNELRRELQLIERLNHIRNW